MNQSLGRLTIDKWRETPFAFHHDLANMESETAHRFDGYEAYPLNLSFEESSLQYLHSELEKRLPSLFVTESSKCSVEVLEAIYAPNTCHVADMEEPDSAANLRPASQPTLLANFLSMLNELKDTLQVDCPVNKAYSLDF